MFAAQPRDGQGGVVERGPVMVSRIEGVVAGLDELAEFHRLVGFVGVHRSFLELARAQSEGGDDNQREEQPAKEERGREGHVA